MSDALLANESRELFRLGRAPYTVRDVLDAAYVRGEVDRPWQEFQRGLACETAADEQGTEADEDAIDSAMQSFRYDHDLITAEETEQWLAQRALTLDDFADHFARRYWSAAMAPPRSSGATPYCSATAEMRELFIGHLMFSGELAQMAERLSWRLAVAAGTDSDVAGEVSATDRAASLTRLGLGAADTAALLAGLDRDDAWLDRMMRLEAAYSAQRDKLLTPQARQRELGSLRLQLTLFELEIIEFDSHDAACEALFCVRDDGMSMEEVATEGRYPYRHEQTLLEQIPPEVQQEFLSVHIGQVLEPVELDGAFRLYRVLGKSDPDADDAAVRQRIEQRLADRYFADLASKEVQWQIVLN